VSVERKRHWGGHDEPAPILTRPERDLLRSIALSDLNDLSFLTPYEAWPDPDVDGWRQTRARLELVFALLDDLGWERGDQREDFAVTVDRERLAAYVRERHEEREEWMQSNRDEGHEDDEQQVSELRVLEALIARFESRPATTP
jgi:hypothetical protein